MIINERTPFQEGLSKLIEIKFGNLFGIIKTESKKLKEYQNKKTPILIIVDEVANKKTEQFLSNMREKGSKIVLLSLEANDIQDIDLDIFNGFLLKNMPTSDMLQVLEEIMDYNLVYVHPDVGHIFLKKLIAR
jgi:hypothetical protein